MWVESFHRFASEAAFLAACDAAGWPRGPDRQPSAPAGIVLDIIGPGIDAPTFDGETLIPGDVDPRWHVNVSRRADVTLPPGLAGAEVIPEVPYRVFADRDPAARLGQVKGRYDQAKVANKNDARLVDKPAKPPRPPKGGPP